MNYRIRNVLALALISALATALSLRAQVSPISVSVNVTGSRETETGTIPKKGGVEPKVDVTQEKQLEITVANSTQTDYSGLRVQYYIFGTDLTSKETSLIRAGNRTVDVRGLGSSKITSESVNFAFTRQYSKKTKGKTEFVPPKGQRFAGYGVQVWQGQVLVAEKFEPPDLNSKVGAGVPQDQSTTEKKKKSSYSKKDKK